MIVGILDPGEAADIYDPTVGSGGFLLIACQYIKDKYKLSDWQKFESLRTGDESIAVCNGENQYVSAFS